MSLPASAEEKTGYQNEIGWVNPPRSTSVWVCDLADVDALRTHLLNSTDPRDGAGGTLLGCQSVHTKFGTGSDDPAGNKATLTATFGPQHLLDANDPTKPFRIRFNYSAEGFTYVIKGGEATWDDGDPIINRNVLPRKVLSITEAILYGVRTFAAFSTYDAWQDKVNADTFLGAAPGFCLFRGASAEPCQLKDGTNAFRHQVTIARRAIEWNRDYREDSSGEDAQGEYELAGGWQAVWPDGAHPKFQAVNFAGLLTM